MQRPRHVHSYAVTSSIALFDLAPSTRRHWNCYAGCRHGPVMKPLESSRYRKCRGCVTLLSLMSAVERAVDPAHLELFARSATDFRLPTAFAFFPGKHQNQVDISSPANAGACRPPHDPLRRMNLRRYLWKTCPEDLRMLRCIRLSITTMQVRAITPGSTGCSQHVCFCSQRPSAGLCILPSRTMTHGRPANAGWHI